jgi:DNA transformation protein
MSYWQLPERLFDDPEELSVWARDALIAARQAAASKRPRRSTPRSNTATKGGKASGGKASKKGKRSKA